MHLLAPGSLNVLWRDVNADSDMAPTVVGVCMEIYILLIATNVAFFSAASVSIVMMQVMMSLETTTMTIEILRRAIRVREGSGSECYRASDQGARGWGASYQ